MKLIDKAAVVAEIEKRKRKNVLTNEGAFEEDIDILSFINNMEVKEVNLEKELESWMQSNTDTASFFDVPELAKYFFNLGLRASNPLSWKDIKTIDKLLNQCVDYSNPYKEVLNRFKAQKGE